MKPSFHTKLLNGPFEDPCLYIRPLREGKVLLFDLGFTMNLSTRDILKIGGIFVSHAHIDHFIGFDNILRMHLKREGPLRLYGPEGFLDRVEGKLKSYTWNLVDEYPLVIEASEVSEREIIKATFRTKNSFRREDPETAPFLGVLMEDSFFKVSAAVLNHKIPCLAFCLEEDFHINIDKEKLRQMNLPVGPWLGEFKKAIRSNRYESIFRVNGNTFTCEELMGIANITKGQKLSYVVDVLGSDENIQKIVEMVKGSDRLYIEAYFLEKDRDRAEQRYHLTARQAGEIARKAGVERMTVFHFSPKYMSEPGEVIREAEEAFKENN
jgi:ribonuclease Z